MGQDCDQAAPPGRLDAELAYDDFGIRFPGHIASPRGVEVFAVDGHRFNCVPCHMTTTDWFFHRTTTVIPGETAVLSLDSGPTQAIPCFSFFPPDLPTLWEMKPFYSTICRFGGDFLSSLTEAEPDIRFDASDWLLGKESARLIDLANQMFREAMRPGFGATLFADAVGIEVAVELVRYKERRAPKEGQFRIGLAPWQMRRLESYVHGHLSSDLSLQTLSDLLGIGTRHLSRVVRRDKGVSVHRWVADLRIAEARRLLAETSLPLQEIARRVAFNSAAAFSTAFRTACGLSPSQYRQIACS